VWTMTEPCWLPVQFVRSINSVGLIHGWKCAVPADSHYRGREMASTRTIEVVVVVDGWRAGRRELFLERPTSVWSTGGVPEPVAVAAIGQVPEDRHWRPERRSVWLMQSERRRKMTSLSQKITVYAISGAVHQHSHWTGQLHRSASHDKYGIQLQKGSRIRPVTSSSG